MTISAPPPPFHRTTIGRYEIAYPLASGGMASVYVGRLPGIAGFEKLVAIKMIHPHLATQKEFIDMFLDEARLSARVHHPNVAEVFEIGEDDGQLFMVCEFVNGRSLKHLIEGAKAHNRRISKAVAAWICAQVCEGLHAAHELTSDDGENMKLVHRDVSPNNVLLSYDGYVKLIDFGVAFANERNCHTTTGMVKGKFGYIAPEFLKGEAFDRRADIYSSGVMLYHLVTGRHPFGARSNVEKLRKSMDGDFKKPSEVAKSVDAELEKIILKAMDPDPAKRFQTAADFGQRLQRYTTKTRQGTGSRDLKRAMNHLFSDKRDAHKQKLKEFRQGSSGSVTRDKWAEAGDGGSPRIPTIDDTGMTGKSGVVPLERIGESQGGDEQGPDGTREDTGGSFPFNEVDDRGSIAGSDRIKLELEGTWGTINSAFLRSPKLVIGAALSILVVLVAGVTLLVSDGMRGETADGESDQTATDEKQSMIASASFYEQSVSNFEYTRGQPSELAFIALPLRLTPSSAELTVDGELVEIKDDLLMLPDDRKKHVIAASAPGYIPEIHTVVADRQRSVSIELAPEKKKKKKRVWNRRRSSPKRRSEAQPKNTQPKNTQPKLLLEDPY